MNLTDLNHLPADLDRATVESTVADYYAHFPYPAQIFCMTEVHDPTFGATFLNQDIGNWAHDRIKPDARVWVAGCGTNQAPITALRFPQATVLGTDLSTTSLQRSGDAAEQLGLTNLTLQRQSIFDSTREAEFDYVICTGVIHHTADPAGALLRLRRALRPGGILEMMVYNRYHRQETVAVQRAVDILAGPRGHDQRVEYAGRLLQEDGYDSTVFRFLRAIHDYEGPEGISDSTIQPIEWAYTVRSLADMAAECSLRLMLPCRNVFDEDAQADWSLDFKDSTLRKRYWELAPEDRWQLVNLLKAERSPTLWYYACHADSLPPGADPEVEIASSFLDTVFRRHETKASMVRRDASGKLAHGTRKLPYPLREPVAPFDRVLKEVGGRRTMRQVLTALDIPTDVSTANRARTALATTANPYLIATS